MRTPRRAVISASSRPDLVVISSSSRPDLGLISRCSPRPRRRSRALSCIPTPGSTSPSVGGTSLSASSTRRLLPPIHVSRTAFVSRTRFHVSLTHSLPRVTQAGYFLRTYSLHGRALGTPLQTVTLPNCPYVTSVQFSPLTMAVLVGYGRCQVRCACCCCWRCCCCGSLARRSIAPLRGRSRRISRRSSRHISAQVPQQDPPQRYAVLRCIEFRADAVNQRVQASASTFSTFVEHARHSVDSHLGVISA